MWLVFFSCMVALAPFVLLPPHQARYNFVMGAVVLRCSVAVAALSGDVKWFELLHNFGSL